MVRAILLLAALSPLSACGPQPVARAAPSGITALGGGGQALLRNQPAALTFQSE